MEAWKFFDYSSFLHIPLYALAPTAARWGLEPFPANIVAIPYHLDKLISNGTVVEEPRAVPYTCEDNSVASISSLNLNSLPSFEQKGIRFLYPYTNVSSSNIRSTPQACPASGCIIVVEGVGKTRIGPARSNIVSVVHGISVVISLLATFGLFKMLERLTSILKKPPVGLNDRDLEGRYNPPPQEQRQAPQQLYPNEYREDEKTAAAKARSIMRCSDLLRRKYELDIEIWGCRPDEESKRRELQRRSDALFREVHRNVRHWRASSRTRWTTEEWQHIKNICRIMDAHAYTEGARPC